MILLITTLKLRVIDSSPLCISQEFLELSVELCKREQLVFLCVCVFLFNFWLSGGLGFRSRINLHLCDLSPRQEICGVGVLLPTTLFLALMLMSKMCFALNLGSRAGLKYSQPFPGGELNPLCVVLLGGTLACLLSLTPGHKEVTERAVKLELPELPPTLLFSSSRSRHRVWTFYSREISVPELHFWFGPGGYTRSDP